MAGRMAEKSARYLPNPELLNLIVGLLSATAINLLTSVGISDPRPPFSSRIVLAGCLMLLSSLMIGGISVWLSRTRNEALAGIPASLSTVERRALVEEEIVRRAISINVVAVLSLALIVASVLTIFY